jgi:hypothetical protein
MATTSTSPPPQEEAWDPDYIDPETQDWDTTTPIQLQVYVDFYINLWKTRNTRDMPLWDEFRVAFGPCNPATFQRIPTTTRRKLADFLRKNGVYAPREARRSGYQALYDLSQEEAQSEWPEAELEAQIHHTDGLTSRLNVEWALKHGKKPLPRVAGDATPELRTPEPSTPEPESQLQGD